MFTLSFSIFFLGATDDTLKKLKYNIERDFNNINLINYNNGYFSEKENERIVKKINETSSNILFVGMGSPKQEIWCIYSYLFIFIYILF